MKEVFNYSNQIGLNSKSFFSVKTAYEICLNESSKDDLIFICGSSFSSIALFNTELFGMSLFGMGLTHFHQTKFQSKRFFSVVLLEVCVPTWRMCFFLLIQHMHTLFVSIYN